MSGAATGGDPPGATDSTICLFSRTDTHHLLLVLSRLRENLQFQVPIVPDDFDFGKEGFELLLYLIP